MCLETALSEMENGPAISLTVAELRVSRCKIARRVGSASAEKTRSNPADRECSTMRLNIRQGEFDLSNGLFVKRLSWHDIFGRVTGDSIQDPHRCQRFGVCSGGKGLGDNFPVWNNKGVARIFL